jgi:thiamine biosynthesis protein ThiI
MMTLILLRYGELALKSKKVRQKFQNALIKNIEDVFLDKKIECRISTDYGRIYVHVDDVSSSIKILRKVFGIVSLSLVIETTSKISDICNAAIKYSKRLLTDGKDFAIRARRSGTHPYTSQDIAKAVGFAVLSANKDKKIKVNLNDPDVEIFVEVRNNKAFIFHEKIPGPGGLPLGTQGKVLALVTDERSMAAAWLMMKRGCKTYITCFDLHSKHIESLRIWDLDLKIERTSKEKWREDIQKIVERIDADGLVFGWNLEEFKEDITRSNLPIFYPVIGLDDEEIEKLAEKIMDDEI